MRTGFQWLAVIAAFFVLRAVPAFSWGSLYPGETHQYIIKTAYDRLKADPAYAPNLFPTFSVIKGHEGVSWTAIGLSGVGPDASGMSAYSDHYYNPATGDGNGPNASAKFYSYLSRENVVHKVTTEAAGKSAAWSAHYLADMFVPYHVVGLPRKKAEKIWKEQNAKHPGVINLGYSVIGSYKLSYATPIKGGDRNFHTELSRYIKKTDPLEADWFDAWYYNGNTDTMMVKTSSHVAWEAAPNYSPLAPATIVGEYQRRAGQGLPGYTSGWKNASPSFNNPWEAQAKQVRQLAIASATETRKNLESYFDNPTPALTKTVQSVYSIWRASFSGLRPSINYQPDGPNSYKVTATIANSAGAAVKTVQTRLTPQDCSLADQGSKAIKGSIPAGGSATTSAWKVKTGDKSCRLKLEVIGSYPIPDLQYASVEKSFFPAPAPPEKPKPVPKTDIKPQRATPATVPGGGAWVLVKSEGDRAKKFYKETMTVSEHGGSYFEEDYYDARSGVQFRGKLKHRHSLGYSWDAPQNVLKPGMTLTLNARAEDSGSVKNSDADFRYICAGHNVNDDGARRSRTKVRPTYTSNGKEDPLNHGKACASTTTWKVYKGLPGETFFIYAVADSPHYKMSWTWYYAWKDGTNADSAANTPAPAKPTNSRRKTTQTTNHSSPPATGDVSETRGPVGVRNVSPPQLPKTSGKTRWHTHATGLYRLRLQDGWSVSTVKDNDVISADGTIELYLDRQGGKWDSMARAEARVAELANNQQAKYPGSQKSKLKLGGITASMVTVVQDTGATLWFIYFPRRNATHFIGVATGSGYGRKELPAPVSRMLGTLEFLR